MIQLTRQKNNLEIRIAGQRLVIHDHYNRPRLFTLDPMRSVFSRRHSTLYHLQHQLHKMTGWLSMSMHAERVLHEAKGLKDGEICEVRI